MRRVRKGTRWLLFLLIFWMCGGTSLWALETQGASPKAKDNPTTMTDADKTLIQSVSIERVGIEKMKRDLHLEEDRLKQTRKEIEARIQELDRLKKEVEGKIQSLHGLEEKEMMHLVKVYEAMSPEEAGPLVEKLDQNIAVELLYRMKDRKAGKILEFVQKNKAVTLSERLAHRKELKNK